MRKEIYITKLPSDYDMDEFLANILQDDADGGGFTDRSKEEVDDRLRNMGIPENTIAEGVFLRITVEEIE